MKILLGMSGGFDSTYTAMKLKNAGHEVEGAILLMHDYTDVESAKNAARMADIPLHIIDCKEKFKEEVVSYFMNEYKNGRTPNPCIVCNRTVKFKFLQEYAIENGFDRISTGHYASVVQVEDGGRVNFTFKKAVDSKKDQTYMLYRLPQEIISMMVLPMANEIKASLKEKSVLSETEFAKKAESQEICFIPDGDYAKYIEDRLGKFVPGDFVDTEGNVLGQHKGIVHYTVGQRKGLGLATGSRIFVTKIDAGANTVTLQKEVVPQKTVEISDIVYSGMTPPTKIPVKRTYSVKLRYLAKPVLAEIVFRPDRTATIELSEPQKAITPGQSAVIYDGDILMAGGFIDR